MNYFPHSNLIYAQSEIKLKVLKYCLYCSCYQGNGFGGRRKNNHNNALLSDPAEGGVAVDTFSETGTLLFSRLITNSTAVHVSYRKKCRNFRNNELTFDIYIYIPIAKLYYFLKSKRFVLK